MYVRVFTIIYNNGENEKSRPTKLPIAKWKINTVEEEQRSSIGQKQEIL